MKLPKTPDTTTKVSLPLPPGLGERTGRECLVLLHGGTIGRKYDLGPGHWTIGRDPYANIVLDADSVSRAHVRIEVGPEESWVVDLDSTNGTFVNDLSVDRAPLRSGDLLKVGDVIFKFLAGDNIESAYHEEIYRMTIHDGLTGIANKRHFDEFLERELARSRRHQRVLSLLLLDIDHFKKINDTFGHLSGDYVLREMAHIIVERVRRDELFARYGGEEFALVCPETDRDGAVQYAEIIRQLVARHRFVFDGTSIPVTVSIGVGSFLPAMERPSELISAADAALYRAKRGGRNKVAV
ncbi:MAG: GGDEF domain-containing protein [Myxococcales bacterium]|nr:GGDEF domain-containing protein [Myxococcales bacterium]MCB9731556.1 GGDEF domain-containing protein [Deltaproteobacteria bacterium]